MRILAIDDDRQILEIIRLMLGKQHEIKTAVSASEGLNCIRASSFDLILLDWMMPDVDGLSFLISLKGDDSTKDIPVIFISGKTTDEDVHQAIRAGAVDYIFKPFSKQDIITRIEAVATGLS